MLRKMFVLLMIFILFEFGFYACKSSSEPKETKGNITGTVKDLVSGDAITTDTAYIYLGDSLLTKTDENGKYLISSMEEGTYALTCSSLSIYFREETNTVHIIGGETVTHDFYLEHLGKICGEFQDLNLFNENVIIEPEMNSWNSQQIFEGTTGATMSFKFLMEYVALGEVYEDDSLLFVADAWAQFVKMIPVGSYTLRGTCAGGETIKYMDETKNIEILPDSTHYIIFFMQRQAIAKLAVK